MVFARYRAVLARPAVTPLFVASMIGRLPMGMESLAVLLLVTQRGTYAAAGVVSATMLIGHCLAMPFVTRAADRLGRRRVLAVLGAAYAASLIVLALVPVDLPHLLPVAAVAGLSMPPLAASVRSVWSVLLPPEERQTVFALEATLQELIFIVGPALTVGLAALGGPGLAIGAAGVVTLAGSLAVAAYPEADAGTGSPATRRTGAVLRDPGVRRLLIAGLAMVAAFSIVEIAVVAFVSGRRATGAAGVVLALWSLGSLLGGLVFGARARTGVSLAGFLLVIGLGFAALAAAPGPVVLTVLLFVCGSAIAPALARLYNEVGSLAPAGAATELFGWLATGFMAGAAAGAALGGVLVSAYGPRLTFLVGGVLALSAAGVIDGARWGRGGLRRINAEQLGPAPDQPKNAAASA